MLVVQRWLQSDVHLACYFYSLFKLWETYGFNSCLEFVQPCCKRGLLLSVLRGEVFHVYIFIQECYLLALEKKKVIYIYSLAVLWIILAYSGSQPYKRPKLL